MKGNRKRNSASVENVIKNTKVEDVIYGMGREASPLFTGPSFTLNRQNERWAGHSGN